MRKDILDSPVEQLDAQPWAPAGGWDTPAGVIATLACRAQHGDREAAGHLLAALRPVLWAAAREVVGLARRRGESVAVEDWRQEASAAALELLPGWNPARGAVLPYFRRRVRATLRRRLRRLLRHRGPGRLLFLSEGRATVEIDALAERLFLEEPPLRVDESITLRQAILTLGPRQRRILYWAYWQRRTDEEIGAALGLSPSAAKEARRRILRALRATLGRDEVKPSHA